MVRAVGNQGKDVNDTIVSTNVDSFRIKQMRPLIDKKYYETVKRMRLWDE